MGCIEKVVQRYKLSGESGKLFHGNVTPGPGPSSSLEIYQVEKGSSNPEETQNHEAGNPRSLASVMYMCVYVCLSETDRDSAESGQPKILLDRCPLKIASSLFLLQGTHNLEVTIF